MSKAQHPITEHALIFPLCEERDAVSFQRDVREKRLELGLEAELGHPAGVVLDQS